MHIILIDIMGRQCVISGSKALLRICFLNVAPGSRILKRPGVAGRNAESISMVREISWIRKINRIRGYERDTLVQRSTYVHC